MLLFFLLLLALAATPDAAASRVEVRGLDLKAVVAASAPPQEFFEVSKPVRVPNTQPCTQRLLRASFANTINSPPVSTAYEPACGTGGWEVIVLRWRATCKGRQFDRISAVWLSGVEILRTSTAEPTKSGIVWRVEKDVTRFASMFAKPQLLVVSLANVVDKTYTGVYHVTLHADFYPGSAPTPPADLVLPASQPNGSSSGYWFQLQGEHQSGSVTLGLLPPNIYRAVLEVFVSFHGNDEFWYTNPADDYLVANNLSSSIPGNGPYREVVALLDGRLVGAFVPFPVVFTGGINPLFWRPVAAIGAFDLPSYDLDVTPFIGSLLSPRAVLSLRVNKAISYWLVDANLHLWLDPGSVATSGALLRYVAPRKHVQVNNTFTGADGVLRVTASRSVHFSGFVVSSFGNNTASCSYSYSFANHNTFAGNGSINTVDQKVDSNTSFVLIATGSERVVAGYKTSSSYPLVLYTSTSAGSNHSVVLDANISHALRQQVEIQGECDDPAGWTLDNEQEGSGKIVIQGSTVTSGTGELAQRYTFESNDGQYCYHRSVEARNSTLIYDNVRAECPPDI